jgi:hypothetical protein
MFTRYLTTVLGAALGLLLVSGGCSSVGDAIDCNQICEDLRKCVDSDLNVSRCAERCRDDADDDRTFDDELDACTDCLDEDYACAEVTDKCPSCKRVSEELL